MRKNESFSSILKELDEWLPKKVETLVKVSLVKNRKRYIMDYIDKNFSKFMEENRPLTSKEVMNMLQLSRQTLGRRIKAGVLKPVNPEAKRNYRFMKNDVVNLIQRKEVSHD